MLNFDKDDGMFHTEQDLVNAKEAGFWKGAATGAIVMLVMFILVGVFLG